MLKVYKSFTINSQSMMVQWGSGLSMLKKKIGIDLFSFSSRRVECLSNREINEMIAKGGSLLKSFFNFSRQIFLSLSMMASGGQQHLFPSQLKVKVTGRYSFAILFVHRTLWTELDESKKQFNLRCFSEDH